jgi:two-component system nitrogen regulation response regulator GlnG
MASGRDILPNDLPPELLQPSQASPSIVDSAAPASNDWTEILYQWADSALSEGGQAVLDRATPMFERTMIEVALKHSKGRKRDAAILLGWGRNTLTRKMQDLNLQADD